jgi:hypothetical protein
MLHKKFYNIIINHLNSYSLIKLYSLQKCYSCCVLLKDTDRLSTEIIDELEKKLKQSEGRLPMYRHRCDERGSDKFKRLEEIIDISERVIIVFSEEFVNNEWNPYNNEALMKKLVTTKVISVTLPRGHKPDQVTVIEDVAFTADWKTDEQTWGKLIHAITHTGKSNNYYIVYGYVPRRRWRGGGGNLLPN